MATVKKVIRATGECIGTEEVNLNVNEVLGKPFICVYENVKPRNTEGKEILEKELSCGLKAYVRFEASQKFMDEVGDHMGGSATANMDIVNAMGLDADTVWEQAMENMKNTGIYFENFTQMQARLMGIDAKLFPESPCDLMYVARLNGHGDQHTAGILAMDCMLDEIKERIGNFIIIPSSIHEIICLPNDAPEFAELDIDNLKEFVGIVNNEAVPVDEVLSDAVFKYDQEGLHRL